MEVITEAMVRTACAQLHTSEYVVSHNAFVTPLAEEFLRDKGVRIVRVVSSDGESVSAQATIQAEGGFGATAPPAHYVDAKTGVVYQKKPEHMTHLYGNVLTEKTDAVIAFRGALDSLQAHILCTQALAQEQEQADLVAQLGELLALVRDILAAQVKGTVLSPPTLLGLDAAALRRVSHNVKDEIGIPHPKMHHDMGTLALQLNLLRTEVRRCELCAAVAFYKNGEQCERSDIILALNRLSSAVYILLCRHLAQREKSEHSAGGLEMDKDELGFIVQEVVSRYQKAIRTQELSDTLADTAQQPTKECAAPSEDIPLEVSARHVHLTQEAVEILFGEGAKLQEKRALSQPGEFLSEQRVKLVTSKGEIANVAVLGPARAAVQCELSATDCKALGIKAPVNQSGNLQNAGDVVMIGTHGILNAKGSVIIAKAHLHLTTTVAQRLCVQDGQAVSVRIHSVRPITLEEIAVRVSDKFAPAMHIDFDEANACFYEKDTRISILPTSGSGHT